jgi:hypothetical protein
MKRNLTRRKRLLPAFSFWLGASSIIGAMMLAPVLCVAQETRARAEQAIRKTIYDLEYAYATGDAATVKRLTAQRTLNLYRLGFDMLLKNALAENPHDSPELANALDADKIFALVLSVTAKSISSQMSTEEIKRRAQKEAQRPITFTSEHQAEIKNATGESSLAVYEDGAWKIDDAANVKRQLLAIGNLTLADRKRIENY